MPSLALPNVEPPSQTSYNSNNPHGKLRTQLQSLLPRNALFYAKIEIHQITSVPLVHGEFAVRWRVKHAQNKLAMRKILKARTQGRKDKLEEDDDAEEKEPQKEDSQGTPIPSVIVSDAAEHMGYTALTSHITTSPSPLASRTSSAQSSITSSTTASASSTSSNLTDILRAEIGPSVSASFNSSALSSNPGSVGTSSSGTPNNHSHINLASHHPPHTPNNSPNPSTLQRTIPSDISTYSPSRGITQFNKLTDHSVSWNHVLHTILKIPVDRETSMLEPSPFKLVVTQRVVHGDPDAPKQPRLGAVYLDLSEYAGVGGEVERRYLLADCRMNVVIKLTTHLVPLTPDLHYTCPSLPKAEILNGVTDILDTDIDIFHTRPRALDLWGPFFHGHVSDDVHTHTEGRLSPRWTEDHHEGEKDVKNAHISDEKRNMSSSNMNGSPNSSKAKKGKGKDRDKERNRSRSHSRVRNAHGHGHIHGWARKFGLDFSDTDGSENEEVSGSEEDYGDEDGVEYVSSPDEDGEDVEYDDGLRMHSGPGASRPNTSYASSEGIQRSKSSSTSKSSYSDGSASHHNHHHPYHRNHQHTHGQAYVYTPHSRVDAKGDSNSSNSPQKNPNPNQKHLDSTFDISKLPLAYGPKTTELLIEALFNPIPVVVPKMHVGKNHYGGESKEHIKRITSTEDKDKTSMGLGLGSGYISGDHKDNNSSSPTMGMIHGVYSPFTTIVEEDDSEVKAGTKRLEGYDIHIGDSDDHYSEDYAHLQDGTDIAVPIVDRDRTIRRRNPVQSQKDSRSPHQGGADLASVYSAGSPRASVENDRVSSKSCSASTRSASGSLSGSGSGSGSGLESRPGSHDGHGEDGQGQDRRGRGLGINVRGWWSKMRLGQGQQDQGRGQDTGTHAPGYIDLNSRPGTPGAMTTEEEEKMVLGIGTSTNKTNTSTRAVGNLELRLGSSTSISQPATSSSTKLSSSSSRPSTASGIENGPEHGHAQTHFRNQSLETPSTQSHPHPQHPSQYQPLSPPTAPFSANSRTRSRSRPGTALKRMAFHDVRESISVGNIEV